MSFLKRKLKCKRTSFQTFQRSSRLNSCRRKKLLISRCLERNLLSSRRWRKNLMKNFQRNTERFSFNKLSSRSSLQRKLRDKRENLKQPRPTSSSPLCPNSRRKVTSSRWKPLSKILQDSWKKKVPDSRMSMSARCANKDLKSPMRLEKMSTTRCSTNFGKFNIKLRII